MYRFPHRVQDVVGARGGAVRGFRQRPGYLFRGERGVVLIVHEAEGWGRCVFGGKKVVKKGFRHLGWIGGSW